MNKCSIIKWGTIGVSSLFLVACSPPAFYLANVTEEIREREYVGVENVEVTIGQEGEEQGNSLYAGRTLTITNNSEYTI